jgi:hypothetical protein
VEARVDDPFPHGLTLKDMRSTAELKAPAGRDIAITLKNEDESFEGVIATRAVAKRL